MNIRSSDSHDSRILIVERWEATEHFVEKSADRPPVDCLVVRQLLEDLGRGVLRSPANRRRHLVARTRHLRQPEIGDDHVTVRV